MMNRRFCTIVVFVLLWGVLLPLPSHSATISYHYDRLNRLTAVIYGDDIQITYAYDAAGNRLSRMIVKSERGNINGDEHIDLRDAILALQVISNLSPPGIRPNYAASGADVNNNQKIGTEEAIYILQKAAGVR